MAGSSRKYLENAISVHLKLRRIGSSGVNIDGILRHKNGGDIDERIKQNTATDLTKDWVLEFPRAPQSYVLELTPSIDDAVYDYSDSSWEAVQTEAIAIIKMDE